MSSRANRFAHLFEHLMFTGSEHYRDTYNKMMDSIGATDVNGTTNNDRTNFFETVPVNALDQLLWIESDRMGFYSRQLIPQIEYTARSNTK